MNTRSALFAGIAGLLLTAGVAGAEASPDATTPKVAPQKKAPEPAKCTHAPGSHIRLAKPEDCRKAARGPYRSYSKQDLESTGETNVMDALRKLDPSIH